MTVILKPKTEITVPPSVRRKAGLKTGDRLAFKVSGRTITIMPEQVVSGPELTPSEAKSVRGGEAQLKRGESKSWRAVRHDLAR
jgi:bifunctional DNA-binding transcriptional regulator/antitoxin component of YhaV-PrlF toxin-antitoxin module